MDPINPIAGNPEALDPNPVSSQIPDSNPQIPDRHGVTILSMAIFVLMSLAAVAFLYYQNQQLKGMLAGYQTIATSPSPTAITLETASPSASPKSASPSTTLKACTQEAKLCPDGSAVGRSGPNCEFAPCPTP